MGALQSRGEWELVGSAMQPGTPRDASKPKTAASNTTTTTTPACPLRCSLLNSGQLLQCLQREGATVRPAAGAQAAAAYAAASGWPVLVVAYEDEHLACVVKPPGIPCDNSTQGGAAPPLPAAAAAAAPTGDVAAGAAEEEDEVASAVDCTAKQQRQRRPPPRPPACSVFTLLLHALQPSTALGALPRPRHVHRLDAPTGGLLLVAKTRGAQVALGNALGVQRQVRRCCCCGGALRCASWRRRGWEGGILRGRDDAPQALPVQPAHPPTPLHSPHTHPNPTLCR